MKILITGANGFIGKNLLVQLNQAKNHTVLVYDRNGTQQEQAELLSDADIVFHLAGVNRTINDREFLVGNTEMTFQICQYLSRTGRQIPLVLASSIQATMANPYGESKRKAEEAVLEYTNTTGSRVSIYRLPNVFGKWCRPNYNSVVATFCHNIARSLPITVSDPTRQLHLVYIDDVIDCFLRELDTVNPSLHSYRDIAPVYQITLNNLASSIEKFQQMRSTLQVPALDDAFTRKLYATYLSYLESDSFAYPLIQRIDPRGSLAEFVKSPSFGQIFVSRTKPGITRGNHFHHTKTEKFLVLEGRAVIRFQHILSGEYIEYHVNGEEFKVIDIPPGYTHSIENVGNGELVTLFWASEIFVPTQPDTYFRPIVEESA